MTPLELERRFLHSERTRPRRNRRASRRVVEKAQPPLRGDRPGPPGVDRPRRRACPCAGFRAGLGWFRGVVEPRERTKGAFASLTPNADARPLPRRDVRGGVGRRTPRKKMPPKSSKFRGVTLFRPTKKWRAQISAAGKTTSLGCDALVTSRAPFPRRARACGPRVGLQNSYPFPR